MGNNTIKTRRINLFGGAGEGWCLECVKKLVAEKDNEINRLSLEHTKLVEAIKKVKETL